MDISAQLFEFCDLRRHLWNQHFARRVDSLGDRRVEDFLEVQRALFRSLVLHDCGMDAHELDTFGSEPIDFIHVRLDEDLQQAKILEATKDRPGAWQARTVQQGDWLSHTLLFVDFFDWYPQDPKGRTSYPYVEVDAIPKGATDKSKRWLLPIEHSSFHIKRAR